MNSQSTCNKCNQKATYDSGFRQECATIGCENFNQNQNIATIDNDDNDDELNECRICDDEICTTEQDAGDIATAVDLCGNCAGMIIVIDANEYVIESIDDCGTSGMAMATMASGEEFYLAEDVDIAGKAAKEYWMDMAKNDPSEFECIVGSENLIAMAMGECCNPGSTTVSSLDEWFDLHIDAPEEHFASYDHQECSAIDTGNNAIDELGFTPTIAYRHN